MKRGVRLLVVRATRCWQTYLVRKAFLHMNFEIFLHMRFCLPGPLWTPSEQQNKSLPASKVRPMRLHLTLHPLNQLKTPNTSTYVSHVCFLYSFFKSIIFSFSKYGGVIHQLCLRSLDGIMYLFSNSFINLFMYTYLLFLSYRIDWGCVLKNYPILFFELDNSVHQ